MQVKQESERNLVARWLRRLTARQVVIAYFTCFALGWLGLAAALLTVGGSEAGTSRVTVADAGAAAGWMLLLAGHAAAVALLAWKGQRWLFAHGALAVLCAGLPLAVLLRELWLVPAFVYLIAVLHVWQAAQHESPGRLQAPHRHSSEFGTG